MSCDADIYIVTDDTAACVVKCEICPQQENAAREHFAVHGVHVEATADDSDTVV